jgi:hypothetical protein
VHYAEAGVANDEQGAVGQRAAEKIGAFLASQNAGKPYHPRDEDLARDLPVAGRSTRDASERLGRQDAFEANS